MQIFEIERDPVDAIHQFVVIHRRIGRRMQAESDLGFHADIRQPSQREFGNFAEFARGRVIEVIPDGSGNADSRPRPRNW